MKNRTIWLAACLMASVAAFGGSLMKGGVNDGNRLPGVQLTDDNEYVNVEARVTWPFSSVLSPNSHEAQPEEGFTIVNVDLGDLEVTGTGTGSPAGVTYIKLRPSGSTKGVRWTVKPAKGLTFTPTKVSANIQRFGTDVKDGVGVTLTANGASQTIGTYTAARNNKTKDEDKYGSEPNYANWFEIALSEDQQQRFSTEDELVLQMTMGVNSGKEGGFANVQIEGILNGTREDVERFSLTALNNPEGAGSISLSPSDTSFDKGTSVTLSATPHFGFRFVNWTDEKGSVVSEKESFEYIVEQDAVLTANYDKLNTYRLECNVEGGANDYMVQLSPVPTEVDGKLMYEEGTEVTLTAWDNKILTFSHWSDGQTTSEVKLIMDGDKKIDAVFVPLIDIIAGWDFYRKGNDKRIADFYAEGNELDELVLRTSSGVTKGWLDKSQEAAGGYEGKPAAVSWTTDQPLGSYYWQTCVDASEFTDIIVSSEMLYNYNAYTTYNIEYSLDGEEWRKAGSIHMEGVKRWTEGEFALPAEADNQSRLFIRWIADKESKVDGTSQANDGISITNIFIFGTHATVDDGKAPVLLSSVPAEGDATASANGKVVLTFDKKVQLKEGAEALLDGKALRLSASGKTVMAEYSGLAYSTEYTFVLRGGSVADMSGNNVLADDITLHFTTRSRNPIKKQLYDFVVPDDGTFKEAIAAANARKDKGSRFRIFVKRGSYLLPYSDTEFITNSSGVSLPNPITYLDSPNVSIIGEERDETIVKNLLKDNTPSGTAYPIEGLHNVTVLYLQKTATNTYLQDITLRNGLNDGCGRGEAVEDNSDKTIMKNVCLYGYQDTYCSNNQNGRFYFEGGVMRGRTDYLCGKGDVVWKGVELRQCVSGGYITAPSVPRKYGYVFLDCTITGEKPDVSGSFTLGRPWGSGTPRALYVNTIMKAKVSDEGWAEMSDGWPDRFAEYNSRSVTGLPIDVSKRKTTFAKTHTNNNPVLSSEEAAELTIENVLGSTDGWDPTEATEQAPAPENVCIAEGMLSWVASDYVLCWAVCKDGKIVDFTTSNNYAVGEGESIWGVRAANEMGGLSEMTVAVDTSIATYKRNESKMPDKMYDLSGRPADAEIPGMKVGNSGKYWKK